MANIQGVSTSILLKPKTATLHLTVDWTREKM